jgi:hypothetical protein
VGPAANSFLKIVCHRRSQSFHRISFARARDRAFFNESILSAQPLNQNERRSFQIGQKTTG